MHRLNENKEDASAATQIKVWLYLHLSEQRHFLPWHFSPFLPLNIVPAAKWQSPDKGQAFIMSLFSIHLGWSAKPPHPPAGVREHEQRGAGEKRVENGKKKSTAQTLWDVSFVSLSDCSRVAVYVALLSDGDLLTCRDREKRLTARSLCCSATLNCPWGGARKTKRENERERERGGRRSVMH